jgi:pimeloyl-ACP methyl ester carboxylesterase
MRSSAACWLIGLCLGVSAVTAAADGLRYRTVEGVDGVPLNVVEAGDPAKPGIVFVHGIGQSTLSFEHQLHSGLADEFHLVAFDLRGHGNSGKPWNREAYVDSAKWAGDLERVRVATGLVRPVLLGWSYGTLVTADYVRHYGTGGLAGIVLVGAYGGFTPSPQAIGPKTTVPPEAASRMQAMQALRADQGSPDLERNIDASRRVARMLTAKTMPPEWVERATLLGMLLPAPAHVWMFDRSLANEDLIPKLRLPFLVFVGGKDVNTPEAVARGLVAQVPGGRVTVFPDSGHSPFVEDPERFNRELGEFAAGALGLEPFRVPRPSSGPPSP